MEYTNINPWELGMSCIVLIGYIWGKVWIHYKPDNQKEVTNENKENNKRAE